MLGEVLCEAGAPTEYVYFPTNGFISLLAQMPHIAGVEVGMVGAEGMLGGQLVLDVSTVPLLALVQGIGVAWRCPAAAFGAQLARSASLRTVLNRYLYVQMLQLSSTAPCLRYHLIVPRLSRWLLMSQDRARSATFKITHEFLGYMLSVRRARVSVAAGALQDSGLIEYRRGFVTVLDRAGLEAAACDCYACDRAAYSRVMAPRKPAKSAGAIA